MNNLQHDMEKKIDESGEKTRAELKGEFKGQSTNSKIIDSYSMIWENEKNE